MIRPNYRTASIGLLVIAVTMYVYHSSTANQFVWDSIWYLTYNELWISSLRPEHLIWMFVTTEMSNWHPLTWLSWALDYQVYGSLDPAGFHLTNNILHAANSFLVYLFAFKIFTLPDSSSTSPRKTTEAVLAALASALVFAVHPQHVESVTWVAERKDLLCLLFCLLAFIKYIDYGRAADSDARHHLNASFAFFVLAGMSKPMAVTMPALLLIIDFFPLGRIEWGPGRTRQTMQALRVLLREKLRFILYSAFLVFITLFAQEVALKEVSFWVRVVNGFNSIQFYLAKLVWPTDLSPFYPFSVREGEPFTWRDLQPLVFFLVVSIACVAAWRRKRPEWLAAWLFYIVSLSPVLGILAAFGLQGAADRYAYLSTLPFYLLFGILLIKSAGKLGRLQKPAFLTVLLVIVVGLTNVTIAQQTVWRDKIALWSRAYQFAPDHPFVNRQLGTAYLGAGDLEQTARYFEQAADLGSDEIDLLAWRARVYMRLERFEDAIAMNMELGRHANTGLPPMVDTQCVQYNIGWNLAMLHHWPEAISVLKLVPSDGPYAEVRHVWLERLSREGGDQEADSNRASLDNLPGACYAPLMEMRRQPLRPKEQGSE
jgi:hypothetical protein